jgi:hypothetical protein
LPVEADIFVVIVPGASAPRRRAILHCCRKDHQVLQKCLNMHASKRASPQKTAILVAPTRRPIRGRILFPRRMPIEPARRPTPPQPPVPRRSRGWCSSRRVAARGESVASHRDGRGASRARRDDREYRELYREYFRELLHVAWRDAPHNEDDVQ